MLGNVNFKTHNGWLASFCYHPKISFQSSIGEEKPALINDAESWKQCKMKKIIEKFSPEDVYNVDETGLFYQLMPEKKHLKKMNAKKEKRSKE